MCWLRHGEPSDDRPVAGAPLIQGKLSIVVTVVDGGRALARCLRGLSSQANPPCLEILAPCDRTVNVPPELRQEFSGVRFLELDVPPDMAGDLNPRVHHELVQRRRAAGLAAASGSVIAMIEDRMVPSPDWAATAFRLHDELPYAGIGGAVANARDHVLSWADFFTDYGQYEPPFEAGRRAQVSEVNASYKRDALLQIEELWRERHYEATVQHALVAGGGGLYVSPQLQVRFDRDDVRLRDLLRERVAWGRLYGENRLPTLTGPRRIVLAAAAPFVAAVLFARGVRQRFTRRTSLRSFAVASPFVLLLYCAWCVGESVAYVGLSDIQRKQKR